MKAKTFHQACLALGALAILLGATPARPLAGAESDPPLKSLPGVVLVKVSPGSALERAGLRDGDVILAWHRPAVPPVHPRAERGPIDTVFDWHDLRLEQAPRGTVVLTVERDGQPLPVEVERGWWGSKVRPRLPAAASNEWAAGHRAIEAGDVAAGTELWRRLEERLESPEARAGLALLRGRAWLEQKEWERAIEAYEAALVEARTPKVETLVRDAYAIPHYRQDELEKTEMEFRTVMELRRETWGEGLRLADSYYRLGSLDLYRGLPQTAKDSLEQALEIQNRLAPGSLEHAATLSALGSLAFERDEYQESRALLSRALEVQLALAPRHRDVALTRKVLGLVAMRLRDFEIAEHQLLLSLDLMREIAPGSLNVGFPLNSLSWLAWEKGDLRQAKEYLREALRIVEKEAPGTLRMSTMLGNLAVLAQDLGDFETARHHLRRALEIIRETSPGSLREAKSLLGLGKLHAELGEHDSAAAEFKRALRIVEKLSPGSLLMAKHLGNLGAVEQMRGELEQAERYLRRALAIQRQLVPSGLDGDNDLVNLGIVAGEGRGDWSEATELFSQALAIRQEVAPGSHRVADGLSLLGWAALERGDLEEAGKLIHRGLALAEEVVPQSKLHAQLLADLGRLNQLTGEDDAAISALERSVRILENQIGRIGSSEGIEAGFRADFVDVHRRLVTLLARTERAEEALGALERSRAQSFLKLLARRTMYFDLDAPPELEARRSQLKVRFDRLQQELGELGGETDATRREHLLEELMSVRRRYDDTVEEIRRSAPRLAALRDPATLEVAEIRAVLEPGTLLLAYSVGPEQSELFALSSDSSLQHFVLPLEREDLRQEVGHLRELITHPAWPRRRAAFYELSKTLYEELVGPASELVDNADSLLIVPDGPLHQLPFAALRRPEEKEEPAAFLAEIVPLQQALSATVYAELRKSRAREPRDVYIAAFGDPLYPAAAGNAASRPGGPAVDDSGADLATPLRRGFYDKLRRLPSTRREVERIAEFYPPPRTRLFLGPAATEEQVKSLDSSPRILHFAVHGYVDDRFPLDSGLALTLPAKLLPGRDNGLLQVWEIFEEVRLDADLVVLSACDSALGHELDGEGLIGLTRAFQYAGARAVTASLWSVADEATADLMVRFHRHLRAGAGAAEALRAAQLELLSHPATAAPYFWAAFQVYGDGG